jgi:D-sedoheptulose 7-phosphate isomerase
MQFLNDYFTEYKKLAFTDEIQDTIKQFKDLAETVKESNSKMMFMGNGASAAIAAHGAVDFTKQGGVRGITFNEADLITCFANDFGYENWMAQAVEHYYDDGDVVVLISVSGTSPSVVNAAKKAKELGLKVVTFTGRNVDNDLRAYADVDFWVNSHAYNIVECIHMIWLCSAIDLLIGKAEYET